MDTFPWEHNSGSLGAIVIQISVIHMKDYDPYLRLLLYRILFSADITDEKLVTDQFIQQLSKEYTPEVFTGLKESVQWSVEHPEYNFKNVLDGLTHSNQEIYQFLKNICSKLNQTN
jgi:hypothetical protein